MIPKAHRLNSQEVERAVKKGRRMSTGFFSINSIPAEIPKVAVIIPKKIAKTSVQRHANKRRIMSALMKYPLPQVHVVITERQATNKMDFNALCEEIRGVLAML